MKKIKTISYGLAFTVLFGCNATLTSQTNTNSTKNEIQKQITMKEYILLIRLPLNYGPTEAAAVRDKWNALTDKWKAENIFVTSFVFPAEGYVVSGSDKTAKKESVVANNSKIISSIVVRCATIEDAILLAKNCPIIEQGGTVEVREVQPGPVQAGDEQIATKNKEAIRNLYENILNNRKTDLLNDLISPDYVGQNGVKGAEGFSGTILSVIAGFPDIKWTIEELIASGDKVVIRWHWVGTNSVPFRGIPASNQKVTDHAIAIYQFKDGKVINTWIQSDRLGVLTQIGVIPENMIPAPPQNKK